MADTVPLSTLPAGSTVTLEGVVQEDRTIEVQLGGDSTTMVTPDPELPVAAVATALAVGDVVQSMTSGQTAVVRWAAEDGMSWSDSLNRTPQRRAEGWVRVGTADLL